MVKLILFAGVGLVVGLLGGTGVVVLTSPASKVPAAVAGREPTPAQPAAPVAIAPARVVAPVAVLPASPLPAPAQVVTASSDAAPGPVPLPVQPPNVARPVPVQPTRGGGIVELTGPPDYSKVSRILVTMKSDESTRILVMLNDDQVEGILRTLGVRQAATLLAQLPPERAATLSRRLMRSATGVR